MSLNVGTPQVEVLDDYRLRVTVGISVVGFNPSESYTGAISVANSPESDNVEISGVVGSGAGEEHTVTLDAGLTESDFPTEVLITTALDDGTQNQTTVALELESGDGTPPGDGDGLSTREWAAIGAGAVGTGYALNRLLDN